ncbi:peptide chain release factor N(5)-glutamine methyltransferase [Polaribacter marinivivus]|uniref:Release factor glutamine methyltransferase n=1 Tax=Polaribacter marinivivus TaxID=1524260 RepID=A0ABV8R8Y0_9FLAO
MTLKELKTHYLNSLSKLYPKTEINTFFFYLIEEYLDLQRIDFSLQPNKIIENTDFLKFEKALNRLKKEEPIQYILGKTEFYGYPFLVTKDTLIPRPETEELVEWVLQKLEFQKKKKTSILDIGTGSGCIAISLAKKNKNLSVSAIDISKEAIEIAKQNAKLNEVNINFIEKDILLTKELETSFDVIVSNPPYVRELEKVEINNNVLQNEPHSALFVSDSNPLIFYSKIADLAKNHLTKNGLLFFEINQYLGQETKVMLSKKGFKNIELRKDLFGNDRMIKANL